MGVASPLSALGQQAGLVCKHRENLYRKGISRLFLLRRLRSFQVSSDLLMFYQTVVESVLFSAGGQHHIKTGGTWISWLKKPAQLWAKD